MSCLCDCLMNINVQASVGPNSKFGPNTEYRICSGFENELNMNTE